MFQQVSRAVKFELVMMAEGDSVLCRSNSR